MSRLRVTLSLVKAILMVSFIFNTFSLNLFAQDRPKLSRNPNTSSNERSSFRFKVSVLVSRNKDSYLYNYTLEQLDYGKISYDSVQRFEVIFPCGETGYNSVKNLQSDGWQLNSGGNFFEPAIGKNKTWGLQFTPTYPIIPNGDNSSKGDKSFGFSFISKCAPTKGQWVVASEQKSDIGEVDVPCGCDGSLSSLPDSESRGYDDRDRDRDNNRSKNKIDSQPTPIETESNSSSKRPNLQSNDGKISVTQKEIIISPDTILKLKMESRLTSGSAKIGDKFRARLFEDVRVDQLSVLPEGCKVEGRVISVEPARKGNKSGTIGINFDRLILPSGRSIGVVGDLTSLNKEQTKIDSEGHVETSSSKRSVVFVGGGAAGGAVIGAIAGGGKGAGIGAAIGAGAGILGVLLTNGQEAIVEPGTEFGLLLTQPLRIPNANVANKSKPNFTEEEQEKIFADSKTIYAAQMKLRELGYLRSVATSRITPSVKRAIINYQNDNDLHPTGLIDYPTASKLGIL